MFIGTMSKIYKKKTNPYWWWTGRNKGKRYRRSLKVSKESHADKIKDLNINPNVCCVFYSKGMKIQIRCFGRAVVNYDNDRSSHAWANMSDMSKECYFQVPSPGTIMDSYNDFSKEIIDKKSEAFSVIDVEIGMIDWLYLKREGHRRANIFLKESAKDTWVSP